MLQNYAVMAMAENKGINMARNIEWEIQECQDRADAIRDAISEKSDQELCAFADWVYNSHLSTVSEFIESTADDQSREPETF